MSIVEMLSFIQMELRVFAQEEERSDANFGSLSGIARFIGEKRPVLAR